MDSFNIAEFKAHLSDLVERAEAGEEIEIKRRGRPVAKLVPISQPRKPIDFDAMKALTDSMTYHGTSAAALIREMRDSRY